MSPPLSHAIGSVLPLPHPGPPAAFSLWRHWTGGRSATAFQTARGALAALLQARAAPRLWLPAYVCRALAEACVFAGVEICWYGLDDDLAPDLNALAAGLRPRDAALVIAYFGRAPPESLRRFAAERPDVLWIEDRAQALEADGVPWAEFVLYSPRKLVGVPDGGLLVGEAPPAPSAAPAPLDAAPQRARQADPQGLAPETWYPAFRAQEAAFDARPLAMSQLTRELLDGIEPAPLAARRRANYVALAQALPDYALWPEAAPAFAPLAFPVRVEDRDGVAARLAHERIYCPHHWPDLPSPAADFPAVHALNAEILSIPCDHRYGPEDMARVAARLSATARPVRRRRG